MHTKREGRNRTGLVSNANTSSRPSVSELSSASCCCAAAAVEATSRGRGAVTPPGGCGGTREAVRSSACGTSAGEAAEGRGGSAEAGSSQYRSLSTRLRYSIASPAASFDMVVPLPSLTAALAKAPDSSLTSVWDREPCGRCVMASHCWKMPRTLSPSDTSRPSPSTWAGRTSHAASPVVAGWAAGEHATASHTRPHVRTSGVPAGGGSRSRRRGLHQTNCCVESTTAQASPRRRPPRAADGLAVGFSPTAASCGAGPPADGVVSGMAVKTALTRRTMHISPSRMGCTLPPRAVASYTEKRSCPPGCSFQRSQGAPVV